MAGSNNLKQFNPDKNNQEDDTTYLADSFRADGAAPGIFNKEVFNKFAYQMSTFVAAMGEMLAAKGYAVSDADFNALKIVLANVMTSVDKIPTAAVSDSLLINSPQSIAYAPGGTIGATQYMGGINFGEVTNGDVLIVTAYINGSKGVTEGSTSFGLYRTGSATAKVGNSSLSTSGSFPLVLSMCERKMASNEYFKFISTFMVLIVGSGTFELDFSARSDGSDINGTYLSAHAFFLKKA